MATVFKLGKGTICRVAMMPDGVTTFPSKLTLTTGSAAAKAATSITITAVPANSQPVPTGSYLGFVNSTTGAVVVAQTTADLVSAATTISVTALPEAIASGSTCLYPLRLSGRTGANIGRDGNRTEVIDFDSAGFASGLTTSVSQTIQMQGNFLPVDAGFLTMEYAFTNLRQVYVEIEMTPISALYTTGRIYKGLASIDSLPVEIPADGIITGNISMSINGLLTVVADVPVA